MEKATNPIGNIYISHRAIATIAHQAVEESYGVVGLTAKNLARGLANVLVNDPTLGVDIQYNGDIIIIDLYVIVEYGIRIKTVATTIAEQVKYKVENLIGLTVGQVNVHVRSLRISYPD